MSDERYGPNVIQVDEIAMLLTTTGGGVAVHLTAPARDGAGREAVWDWHLESDGDARLSHYDQAALAYPRWSQTTLCGRVWAVMVGGDGGPIGSFGEVSFAPTCRRCLTIMDRHFPLPSPDPRLDLVVQLTADVVIEQRGFAEVHGVPGDQQNELRRRVCRLISERTGRGVSIHAVSGVVHVICETIYERHREQGQREAAEAISALLQGETPPRRERNWVIDWGAWEVP